MLVTVHTTKTAVQINRVRACILECDAHGFRGAEHSDGGGERERGPEDGHHMRCDEVNDEMVWVLLSAEAKGQ